MQLRSKTIPTPEAPDNVINPPVLATHSTPQPPADGEVGELAAELRHFIAEYQQFRGLDPENIYSLHQGDPEKEAHLRISRLTRATDLLERQHLQPEGGDIHYAWELHDAEGDWQAGGSAITLESVRREGNHYLQTYSQDGPHTLIIQRVSTTPEAPNV
jgi:hypothetical protein